MFMGYIYGVLAVFFWSFNVIVARYFANTFTPWQISFYRWFFASVILLPLTYRKIWYVKDELLKNWKLILSLSLSGIVLMNTFSYVAGKTIDAVEMSLISVVGPVFIVILSAIFLHIKLHLGQVLGILVAFFGVFFVIVKGDFANLAKVSLKIGVFWMSMLALFFAIYSVLMNFKPKSLSHITLLAVNIFVGTVIIFPFFVYDVIHNPVCEKWNLMNYAILLYMGIFNSILAYLFWNMALEKIGNIKASVIYYLTPVFSFIEAYFILDEKIYISQVVGGIIIICGIYFTNKYSQDSGENIEIERP